MKIVVNRCKGSFSLSARAVARLAELNGQKAYFFANGAEITLDDTDFYCWYARNTNNPTRYPPLNVFSMLTREERLALSKARAKETLEQAPKDRADPKLVQVVEELGGAAGGSDSKLEVIEIPDGIEWEILADGGYETVHEKHRRW